MLVDQLLVHNKSVTQWESKKNIIFLPGAAPPGNWSCYRCNYSELIHSVAEGGGRDIMTLLTAASQAGTDGNHYSHVGWVYHDDRDPWDPKSLDVKEP